MNIFYLDKDPRLCAQYHTDKHVVKMILESAQLLCTAVNTLAGEQVTPYKSPYVNHHCSVWVRESFANWNYVWNLMYALDLERQFRYKHTKEHKIITALNGVDMYFLAQSLVPRIGLTTPALAMPAHCKISSDPVECYREYYRKEKVALHKWTGRDKPYWL